MHWVELVVRDDDAHLVVVLLVRVLPVKLLGNLAALCCTRVTAVAVAVVGGCRGRVRGSDGTTATSIAKESLLRAVGLRGGCA